MAVQGHANQNDFQAMAVASGIDEASLRWLLPFCSKQLELQGLACPAASSKGLRTACLHVVQTEAASLVIAELGTEDIVDSTNTFGTPGINQRHAQAAIWGLHFTPTAATAAGVAEQLVRLPLLPLLVPWAVRLQDAGVRISYEQVLTAANNMVPGAGLWLHLQHARYQLLDDSSTPAAAAQICCDLQPHELDQLLVSTTTLY
jgi:hypothetical protein